MLKILWKRGKIAPEEQFLPLSTIFYYLVLDFYVKTGIRFSLRDKRLFEITEVEITRVDCSFVWRHFFVVPPCNMMSVRLYEEELFNRFTARVLRESLSICLYSCCCCCIVVLRPR